MPTRTADAVWEGGLQDGKGTMRFGTFQGPYTFASRFEEGEGTNPEELVGAAHAGCFSMALSGALGRAGYTPNRIETQAQVDLEQQEAGFKITRITLITRAEVPGIDEETFLEQAQGAKRNCPISQLVTGAEVELQAELV